MGKIQEALDFSRQAIFTMASCDEREKLKIFLEDYLKCKIEDSSQHVLGDCNSTTTTTTTTTDQDSGSIMDSEEIISTGFSLKGFIEGVLPCDVLVTACFAEIRSINEKYRNCNAFDRSFKGHCNARTIKDVNFYGANSEYIVSGSDDGNFFIWDKETTDLLFVGKSDSEVVNCIQGHPYDPVMAISGVDSTIKIWSAASRNSEDGIPGIYPIPSKLYEAIIKNNEENMRLGGIPEMLFGMDRSSNVMYIRLRDSDGGDRRLPAGCNIQ